MISFSPAPRLAPFLGVIASLFALLVPTFGGQVLRVDQNDPQAADEGNDGSSRPFRTISGAARLAVPGDTISVMPGVYRECIAPEQGGTKEAPITYEAAPGHQVFVRGSDLWHPQWQSVDGHPDVYQAAFSPDLFPASNPYRTAISISSRRLNPVARPFSPSEEKAAAWLVGKESGRLPRTLGQLFVDGQPLRESETVAEVQREPGTWIANPEGTGLIVHFFPSRIPLDQRAVELSVRNQIFAPKVRGLEYITVRGFVFEHAANQGPFPQQGAVSLRSGGHWLVEDNIIRFAKTTGLDAGGETFSLDDLAGEPRPQDRKVIAKSGNIIRGNLITDNGLSGLAAWNCPGIVIKGNRVERNNALGLRPARVDYNVEWEEHAGIKLHNATGALIEGNLVCDNDAHGIWIDNGFTNARITHNTVLNNAGAGIMLELGFGPCLIDRNVTAFTRYYSAYFGGDGIYGHDASGITVAHNLSFANTRYGIFYQRITNRKASGQLVEASNIRLLANLLFDNARGAINLPAEGPRSRGNFSDYNVIGRRMPWLTSNQGEDNPFTSPVAERFRAFKLGDGEKPGDIENWGLIDGMVLADWQKFTGWDKHSVLQNPRRLIVRPLTAEIEVQLADQAGRLQTPPIDSLAIFPGEPLPGHESLAGPWPHLGSDNERFFLWPAPNP